MQPPSPPQTILVPIDYGEPSRLALEQALGLARSFKARLVLLFAWAAPYANLPIASDHELQEEHRTLFDRVRKECEDTMVAFIRQVQSQAPDVELSWLIVSGDPGRVILEQAAEMKADLVLIGSHGRHGAARWFLGSVAEAVVRHAPCPVLVVPAARAS